MAWNGRSEIKTNNFIALQCPCISPERDYFLPWAGNLPPGRRALSGRVVVIAILIWASKFLKRAQKKLSKNSTLLKDVSQGPLPLIRSLGYSLLLTTWNGLYPLWHLPAGNHNSCIHRAHDILKTWCATVHTTSHSSLAPWLVGSQFNLLQSHLFFTYFLFLYMYIPSFRIWGDIPPFRVIGSSILGADKFLYPRDNLAMNTWP